MVTQIIAIVSSDSLGRQQLQFANARCPYELRMTRHNEVG